jgi:hypothetical protein
MGTEGLRIVEKLGIRLKLNLFNLKGLGMRKLGQKWKKDYLSFSI